MGQFTLGILFDGMQDVNKFIAFAKEAEKLGIHSVWIAEHFCFRDALITAAALVKEIHKVEIVPGPLSPYVRHPMILAMAISTLGELAPERIGINLGVGNINAQHEFGVNVEHPISTMIEAIETIRKLLEGNGVYYQGKRFVFHGAKMGFTVSSIPIYLSAIGPKMLATAGLHADGVVLSAGISPKFARLCLEKVECARNKGGHDQRPFKRVGFVIASAANETEVAYDASKGLLSYLFRTPFLEEDWKLNNINIDHQSILEAIRRRDWEKAKSYISDEAVHFHTISGSPPEFKKRFQEYMFAGYDQLVLFLVGSPENRKLALKLALDIAKKTAMVSNGAQLEKKGTSTNYLYNNSK